jgi:hypothetical protein
VEQSPEPDPAPAGQVLPPDPGAAGRATLQGIDSDNDGLRDDVQIHVHDSAYSDAATRAASIRLAKAFQLMVTSGADSSRARTATASMNRAIDCLYSVDPDDFGDYVEDIEAAVVNTGDRARAYVRAGAFVSGGTYSVSTTANNAASCSGAP